MPKYKSIKQAIQAFMHDPTVEFQIAHVYARKGTLYSYGQSIVVSAKTGRAYNPMLVRCPDTLSTPKKRHIAWAEETGVPAITNVDTLTSGLSSLHNRRHRACITSFIEKYHELQQRAQRARSKERQYEHLAAARKMADSALSYYNAYQHDDAPRSDFVDCEEWLNSVIAAITEQVRQGKYDYDLPLKWMKLTIPCKGTLDVSN